VNTYNIAFGQSTNDHACKQGHLLLSTYRSRNDSLLVQQDLSDVGLTAANITQLASAQ